ncbi:MAG: HlyD family secretion protein [Aureliella sp.]
MSWILGGIYCGVIWLVFAKLKLVKLSLPLAIVAGSIGPLLIVALILCAQYCHPFTSSARVFKRTVPIIPQLKQIGRVTEVLVQANQSVEKGDVLFRVDPVPYENAVSRLTIAVAEAKQGQDVAEASVKLADAGRQRAIANLDFSTEDRNRKAELFESNAISDQEYELAVTRFNEATAALAQAEASVQQADLSVELAGKKIEQAESQLADAEYDLSQTTVIAPEDGYVTNMQLHPGMSVGGAAGAVMTFVLDNNDQNEGIVVAAFNQKNFLRIKEGQYCEVALFGYPGEIFTGRVVNAIDISGAGQLQASGVLPSDLGAKAPAEFAVRVKLDEEGLRVPGGSQAQVAVYTEEIQIAGIPIMFLIRAQSWIRYLM